MSAVSVFVCLFVCLLVCKSSAVSGALIDSNKGCALFPKLVSFCKECREEGLLGLAQYSSFVPLLLLVSDSCNGRVPLICVVDTCCVSVFVDVKVLSLQKRFLISLILKM